MKRICLLLWLITTVSLAQETIYVKVPSHGYPPLQTFTPEQIQELMKVKQPPKSNPSIASFGSLPAGTIPTPSPEVASINRFKDIAVNLYTGTPIISLPLYNLQEAGLSVPISLDYNASGMKNQEVASWAGAGWSLNAGGMITRVVKGLPDEGKLDINDWTSSNERKGYYLFGFNYSNNVNDDSEPDEFLMNINGMSYKFRYKYSGVPRFIFFPDADIKVTPTFQLLSGSSIVGKFTKFEVLMPDGTKYVFGEGHYETSAEIEVKDGQDLSVYPGTAHFNHYWKNEAITTAWYLTQMVTPYGQTIHFDYDNVQYSFFTLAESQASVVCPSPSDVSKKIDKVYIEGSSLAKISTLHKKVEFNKRVTECTTDEDGQPLCYLTNIAPPRLDIDSWTQNPVSYSTAKKLVEMTVMDNVAALSDTLKYKFDYGHFTGVEDDLPSGYTTSDVGFSHQKRLRLQKVTYPDYSTYRFRYNGDDSTYNGKSRLNMGIDHWGYANGSTGNRSLTGLIPKDFYFSTCTPSTSNRETDAGFNFYGSLDSIVVSTGSQIKFNYELHYARNYKNGSTYKPIGGVRIKNIHTKDLVSNIETIKNYSYLMADSLRPSGFLCLKPTYRFIGLDNSTGSNSGIYDRIFTEIGRPIVGYNHVTEQISDVDGNKLGRTEYFFDQDTTELTTQYIRTDHCTGTYPHQTCDTTYYYLPEQIRPNSSYGDLIKSSIKGGNLLKTSIFNQLGDTLSIQINSYTSYYSLFDFTVAAKIFKVNGYNLGYYSFGFDQGYYLNFIRYRLQTQTNKIFSQNGTNPVSTTTNYTYKNETTGSYQSNYPGMHNFLVKTETFDGQGHTITNLTKYVADFAFLVDSTIIHSTCVYPYVDCDSIQYVLHVPRIGSQMRAIYELQNKHILAPTVESTATNNGRVLESTYNRYDKLNVAGTGFKYFLRESFALAGVASNSTPNVSYTPPSVNDTLIKDARYYSIVDYQDYNPLGLSKQIKPFGAAISTTAFDSLEVLPIKTIQNVSGNMIDTTTYEYNKKIFGLSKQTSPNHLEVKYVYYTDAENHKTGQLKQTTDKDNFILSHYEYPYLHQSLLGTAGAFTTDSTKNRIVSRIPRIATTNPYQDFKNVSTAVSYSDGNGRALQSVGFKRSPALKDLLGDTPKYDSYGRMQKAILPVASTVANGQFQSGSQTLAQTFYGDTAAFAEIKEYEKSPISRAFKTIGAGAKFRPSKYEEQKFETGNFSIAKYELDISGYLQISSYSGNEILKTTTIDEQGQKNFEFHDKSGRLLERHTQFMGDGTETSHYLITTYIYDFLGRLAVIIPPKLYGVIPNNTPIATSSYLVGLYLMKYDERNRVVEKHTPDAGWSYLIYNRLGQVVMQQDARLRTNYQWKFAQFDAYGRNALTGVLTDSSSRATLQTLFDNYTQSKQYEEQDSSSSGIQGYTHRSFPITVNESEIMTVNYYDDYSWKNSDTLQFKPYKGIQYTNAKGLMTGNKVRRLDTQVWLRTALYYDNKNRLIQSQNENRFGKINQTDNVYDFIGQLLEERTIYRKPSQTDIESRTAYSYDHAGRKTNAIHFYTGHAPELLATYEYDELGRLIRKNLNEATKDSIIRQSESLNKGIVDIAKKYILIKPGTAINADSNYLAFIGSGLQKVEYTYNIRGDLRGINLTSSGRLDSSKVFSMKLDYFEDDRFYNGNLSKQSWKTHRDTTQRQFLYDYDKASRLNAATYAGKGSENYSLSGLDYDLNGNIKTLTRNSKTGTSTWGAVDALTYSYKNNTSDPDYANQLLKVEDAGATTGVNDFKNGFTGTDEYGYYPDGSLKFDKNKGIDSIRYNYLGLPSHIFFDPDKYIENIYTADGIKLSQKIVNGSTVIQTDYIGDLLYLNDTLKSVSYDEGKIRFDSLGKVHYQYFISDNLGNTRVIFEKLNDSVFVAQENHYGAWGEILEGLGQKGDWNFLYQGNEFIDNFGYNTYDFNARQYDANLGRFNGIDAVDNHLLSGYAGMMNNPVFYTDKDGNCPVCFAIIGAAVVNGFASFFQDKDPVFGFFKGAAVAGAAAFVGGATLGAFSASAVAGVGSWGATVGAYATSGFAAGFASGGLGAALDGGNVLQGALAGGIIGGITGGIGGALQYGAAQGQIYSDLHNSETAWTGTGTGDPIYNGGTLNSVVVKGQRNVFLDLYGKRAAVSGFWGTASYIWNGGHSNGIHFDWDGYPTGYSPMMGEPPAISIGGIGGIAKATNSVYQGLDDAGVVRYVGITSRNVNLRFNEHLNSIGTGKELLRYEAIRGATNLTRSQARIWEQGLIDQYGLGKNGGLLLNKINSIAPK